jgi:ribosome-binding factor A
MPNTRSQRQLRVGEAIRHALANVLMRGDAPWPKGFKPPMITVTEVDISPDLQNATAFIMPLGGKDMAETVRVLNHIVGFFRHALAETVNLRYVPKLVFKTDTSFDYSQKIERLLQDPVVAKDLDPSRRD